MSRVLSPFFRQCRTAIHPINITKHLASVGLHTALIEKATALVLKELQISAVYNWRWQIELGTLMRLGLTPGEAVAVYNAMWRRVNDRCGKRFRARPRDDDDDEDAVRSEEEMQEPTRRRKHVCLTDNRIKEREEAQSE